MEESFQQNNTLRCFTCEERPSLVECSSSSSSSQAWVAPQKQLWGEAAMRAFIDGAHRALLISHATIRRPVDAEFLGKSPKPAFVKSLQASILKHNTLQQILTTMEEMSNDVSQLLLTLGKNIIPVGSLQRAFRFDRAVAYAIYSEMLLHKEFQAACGNTDEEFMQVLRNLASCLSAPIPKKIVELTVAPSNRLTATALLVTEILKDDDDRNSWEIIPVGGRTYYKKFGSNKLTRRRPAAMNKPKLTVPLRSVLQGLRDHSQAFAVAMNAGVLPYLERGRLSNISKLIPLHLEFAGN